MRLKIAVDLFYAAYIAVAVLIVISLLSGCAPQFNRQQVIDLASPAAKAAIDRKQVIIGMSAPEVVAAWGFPNYTRDTATASSSYSMWVYEKNLADAGLGGLLMSAYIARHRCGSARSQVSTYRYVHLKDNRVIAIGN